MSARSRLMTSCLTALVVLTALGTAAAFLLFVLVAAPFLGDRLGENFGAIAARYFPLAGVLTLILCGIGAVWMLGASSKRLAQPLSRLKHAAAEIRDGNLGYELVVTGHDEFTELSACFEQMRVRLLDATRTRVAAETEHKTMMASVCHDLKTPITSIIGYADGILDGVAATEEKTLEYAAVIRKKARSLQRLADDLSLLSRLENAQLPLDMRKVNFGAFLAELFADFTSENPGIRIAQSLPSGLYVSLDREKMGRVIMNLLQNSVKYKKPEDNSPELCVTLKKLDASALLTITDNGIGIPAADLPHVFDEFYRGDASRGKTPGSGLGLSIARHIVKLHGGKIWLIGGSDGVSVNITLPAAAEPDSN